MVYFSCFREHTLHELNSFALGNRDPALASNLVTEIVSISGSKHQNNIWNIQIFQQSISRTREKVL